MLAKDLISDVVPALKTSDTGVQALNWMEIFRVKHLPIVNHREFLGLLSDQDIFDLNDPEEPIGNHELSLQQSFVSHHQHIYEVIESISRLKLTVVPVLNEERHFLGVITLEDLSREFANLSAMQHPGGIVELEMPVNDYSLTEISNIVESNNVKILSLYVSQGENPQSIRVTMKINSTDITSVLETFTRYNYKITASYMHTEDLDDFYQDRLDEFFNFLNV